QSTTMNSTRPWALRTGTRNSAPTSTDSGGRSPSGFASQRGYWRATYPAKSFRRLVCNEWSASERPGSFEAARRTSQRDSSTTNTIHSRQASAEPRRPPSSRGRAGDSEALVFEEAAMRGEPVHLIIHPQDALRSRHGRKLMATGEPRQRDRSFRPRVVRPAGALQLHRRHRADDAAGARARPPPPRSEAGLRDEARHGAPRRR